MQQFLGRLPTTAGGGDGRGLLGVAGGPRDSPSAPYRDLVYGTGLALADAMSISPTAVAQGPYIPENGAQYPASTFGGRLEQAAMLLKRTSRENGSQGTDHAYATAVFVAGGAVRGGVYNCDAGTWAAGDLFSQSGRYIRYRTDYRAVFAEIFTRHFNDSPALLDRVIPGYSALAQASPAQFAPLGFLEPAPPPRSTTLDLY